MSLFCNHQQELQFLRNRVSDQDELIRNLTAKLLEVTAQFSTQLVALSNPAVTRELNRTERERNTTSNPPRSLLPGGRPNYRPASPRGATPEGLASQTEEAESALAKHLAAPRPDGLH